MAAADKHDGRLLLAIISFIKRIAFITNDIGALAQTGA
jgi:hypothetical protein